MKTTRWTITVVSEVRRGPWREDHYQELTLWGVMAHDHAGRRFGYIGPTAVATREAAEALAARIRAHAEREPDWTPAENCYWSEVDPVYGSDEYERQETEAHRAARDRADDAWYYVDFLRDAHTG